MDFVRDIVHERLIISFRDFAREVLLNSGRMGTKPGERMFHFLLELSGSVSLTDLRTGKHQLSRYYRGVTRKTLTRDLNFLKQHGLVVIQGDELKANLAVMTQFLPPAELRTQTTDPFANQKPQTRNRKPRYVTRSREDTNGSVRRGP